MASIFRSAVLAEGLIRKTTPRVSCEMYFKDELFGGLIETVKKSSRNQLRTLTLN